MNVWLDAARIPAVAGRGGAASMSAASQRTAFKPAPAEILMFAGEGVMAAGQDGRVLMCNRAAEEIFGYEAEEILGLPIETLIAEPRRPASGRGRDLAPEWAALIERRRMAGQRKHGGKFPVEATLSHREIEGHMVLIAVVRDATGREAERLLLCERQHRMKNALATVQAWPCRPCRAAVRPRPSSMPSPGA
jgi:PAS domain S-box-containing protein